MIVTLSETTRGMDGWFTTATPEGGESVVILIRHHDADGKSEARKKAWRKVGEYWPSADIRSEVAR